MKSFILILLISPTVLSILQDDEVKSLPGLLFSIDYKLYSGYLNANENGTWKMHYWLIESKSNPAEDPLLVWFNGGPGCSSFGGAFEELGPFYVNWDSATLYENIYSWNAKANILFLEAPIGVGFSYDTTNPNFYHGNDEQSAYMNYQALQDFFRRVQPKYFNRTFFLSGESYAGVYIPMLSAKLTEGINNGSFPNQNFQGSAIGNGFMSAKMIYNSMVLWAAYHGKISLNDWNTLKTMCKADNAGLYDVDNNNFFSYLTSTNGIDFVSNGSKCGNLVYDAISMPDNMDQYNYYQDCWNPEFSMAPYNDSHREESVKIIGQRRRHKVEYPARRHRVKRQVNQDRGVNTATLYNYDSTDGQLGYPCWNGIMMRRYVNREDLQKAIHIDKAWQKSGTGSTRRRWEMCNNQMYDTYKVSNEDQSPFFKYVLDHTKKRNFRFLIYNGDTDTVCNYLGDSIFMQKVAEDNQFNISSSRGRWEYRGQTAGFIQRYRRKTDSVIIDVLTVKGAGHMVPNDRPSASVQMITNFLHPSSTGPNYNSTTNTNPTPSFAKFLDVQKGLTASFAVVSVYIFIATIHWQQ